MGKVTYCKDCKKEISLPSKYCSRCFLKNHNPTSNPNSVLKMIHLGKNHPNYKDGRTSKQHYCKDCGTKISRRSGVYGLGRCKKCAKQGKLHSNYIDGRSWIKYPKIFNSALKSIMLKRDNYICQGCFMTQEEHFIVYGRDLEIHHIDYNRNNCKDNNLITLCKQCNIRANFNRDYWEKYFQRRIELWQTK